MEEQFKAGAADQLQLAGARLESSAVALMQLDGRLKLLQAAAALEDAVQRPMDLPEAVFNLEQTPGSAGVSPARRQDAGAPRTSR
jgi:hypothetical protein